jgi:L-iditol 2-dehydrogenase
VSRRSALVRVARIHGPGDVRVGLEPRPEAAERDVELRVTAVGLCGSDLHWFDEGSIGDARLERPLVLGHEFAGIVAAGPRAGERVVADPSDPCGTCDVCGSGRSNLCPTVRFAGHGTTDGALREELPWPGQLLHPLPDAIGDDAAALLEPLGIALHALELGALPPGASAGVYGCGPIGLLLVQLLRLRGTATIVATDRLPHRVVAAAAMGATDAVLVEPGEGGRSGAADRPVDVAYETAGDDGAVADAIAAVRPGGRVVLVGIPPGDRTTFRAAPARHKGLTLVLCRRMRPEHLLEAVDLAAGGFDLSSLISHRFPLEAAPAAFATLAARRGLKVIVRPADGAP